MIVLARKQRSMRSCRRQGTLVLLQIAWTSFCCGCSAFGVWFFIVASSTPVKHYLCVWLLILQFIYFLLTLITTLCSSSMLAIPLQLLLSVNFCISSVVAYVSGSVMHERSEILRLDNFSLHVAPALVNFIELLTDSRGSTTQLGLGLGLTGRILPFLDVFAPTFVMLFYYNLFFTKELYSTDFNVDLSSSIIVGLVSGALVVFTKELKVR